MLCKCGYWFSESTLKALKADEERPYESFAVIRDRDYAAFIRSEVKVLESEDKGWGAHLEAVARSSELVGWLARCPACGRLVLLTPGGESKEFYTRDE